MPHPQGLVCYGQYLENLYIDQPIPKVLNLEPEDRPSFTLNPKDMWSTFTQIPQDAMELLKSRPLRVSCSSWGRLKSEV